MGTFEMMQLLWEQFDSFLIKLPYDTSISLIRFYPKGKKANVLQKTLRMFIAASFVIVEKWEHCIT